LLQGADVPLLIFSAGIANIIAEAMTQKLGSALKSSTHIISNFMIFDSDDRHVGFSEPLIHMFNKDEVRFSEGGELRLLGNYTTLD
jgi:2-hydroxy-3-keto-5-methylthiopentenyl-1-phosphate phosphatase